MSVFSLMEDPAILSGLLIAYKSKKLVNNNSSRLSILQEIVTNGSILLLVGSFFIEWISGAKGMEKMDGFLVTPFQGILSLFLLNMGLLVTKHLSEIKVFSIRFSMFGIYMPLIGSVVVLSSFIGLDLGTGFYCFAF